LFYPVLPSALFMIATCQADPVEIGATTFSPQRLEVGEGEAAVAFGDFNGDGHQDLVVTDRTDHDLVVLLGDGRGGLARAGRFPAGQNPTDMAVADINGDGTLDVVVANHETSYLTLLEGDGRGGFQPASNSPLPIDVDPHPHAIRARDLDGDRAVDLIVDHRGKRGLLALGGMGEGAFETPGTVIEVGGDPYLGLAIGDLNGDGRLDLVTPNPNEVGVLLNAGLGHIAFDRGTPLPAASPFAVALADINDDDNLDVIAASDGADSEVQIFLGDGRGGFREAGDAPFRMAAGAKNIAVGDIDGDGVEDALVSSWSSDVLIVRGGQDAFQTVRIQLPDIDNPSGLAVVDLNEDGRSDFVIADGVRSLAAVYLSYDQ
jgi:hypothetical protein